MALEVQVRSSYIIIYKVGRWPNLSLVTKEAKLNNNRLGIHAPLIWKPHPRDKALEVWKP